MNNVKERKIVDSYFKLVKNWNNARKKELIIKLTSSIDSNKNKSRDFSASFGAWKDERSAEEIILDIYSNRHNVNEIVEF